MRHDFQITSDEGLPIRGTLEIPVGAKSIVVILHGFKGFKEWGFFPWIAEQFALERAATCRFNMSRSGVGEDDEHFDRLDLFADDTYSTQLDDVQAVLRYVGAHDDTRHLPVFLFGHSRGGGIAILSAANYDGCAGVMAWSSIATVHRWDDATVEQWRRDGKQIVVNARTGQDMPMSTRMLDDVETQRENLDIERAASRLVLPLLLVHGGRDESVSPEESRALAAAAPNASLVIIEGGSHTYGAIHPLVNVPRELKMAMMVTRRWLRAYSR